MFPILDACELAPDVRWFRIQAPLIARHRQSGQFVIVRLEETGERIPLTIADCDPQQGTIDLIVKAIGKTTMALCRKQAGDVLADVAGPLGRATEIVSAGHAVLVGGGVGTAVIYSLAKPLRAKGNVVSAIIGGRTRSAVILEDELSRCADHVYPCTDDGTHGYHGTVAGRLAELIARGAPPVGAVYAAGPVPMMRAIAELTRPTGIRTIVSLNPIMVDGTGMCGGCRVHVGGRMRFACVDGPEFDAHQVDFDELANRLETYRPQEQISRERAVHRCQLVKLDAGMEALPR